MATRKPKAKRRGRPPLPRDERREVYSVRLLREQAEQAKRLSVDGSLTTAVEFALKHWIEDNSPSNQTGDK